MSHELQTALDPGPTSQMAAGHGTLRTRVAVADWDPILSSQSLTSAYTVS